MTVALDRALVDRFTAASSRLAGLHSANVALEAGEKEKMVLEIVDGRVVGGLVGDEAAAAAADGDSGGGSNPIGVTVPVTADQLAAFLDGSASFARSYMMGDVKPVGSTGALLALIELFESVEFRAGL